MTQESWNLSRTNRKKATDYLEFQRTEVKSSLSYWTPDEQIVTSSNRSTQSFPTRGCLCTQEKRIWKNIRAEVRHRKLLPPFTSTWGPMNFLRITTDLYQRKRRGVVAAPGNCFHGLISFSDNLTKHIWRASALRSFMNEKQEMKEVKARTDLKCRFGRYIEDSYVLEQISVK